MPAETDINKGKRIIFFALVFVITTLIAGFLIAWIWQPVTSKELIVAKTTRRIAAPDNTANVHILSGRMELLNELDRQYARLLSAAANSTTLDSINRLIEMQESRFRISLDSISLLSVAQPDTLSAKLVKEIVLDYRSVLQSRPAIASLRSNAMSKFPNTADNVDLMIAQDMLKEKNDSLVLLRSRLRIVSGGRGN